MPVVEFYELDGYPQETRTLKGFQATRKLVVAWDDRYTLRELLIHHPPELYPYIPAFGAMVVAISMQPVGKQLNIPGYDSLARYDHCLLSVQYATPAPEDPQPYPASQSQTKHEDPTMVVSESYEPYAEASRLDYTKFKWSNGDPLTSDEAPVRIVYRAKYVITRHNQANAPSGLLNYVGRINSATVTPVLLSNVSFPAHTLLFQSPNVATQADDDGDPRYDVTYRFLYKEEGWRKFWHSETRQEETIFHIDGGAPYDKPDEIDFNNLLPQGS